MKTPEEFKNRLLELNACEEARIWGEGKTDKEAWEQCERGDWLLWWAIKEYQEIRSLTLAKARCAKLVIHLMKDQRSIDAVKAAERFGLGEIELEELNAYSDAARNAIPSAGTHVAIASAAIVSATYASAAYTYAADNTRERQKILKQYSTIIRENLKPSFI